MGAILKVNKLTTFAEGLIVTAVIAVLMVGIYFISPGLRVSASKQLKALTMSTDKLDNVTKGEKLPLPSSTPSTSVVGAPLMRIAGYPWNGNTGLIGANGGPRTTKGSLMEKAGLNLEIVPLDGVSDIRNMQIAFCGELASGKTEPTGEKTAFAVSIMMDGGPYYEATTQEALDQKFGKGKFHINNIAAIGLSYGEDKLIGPKIWKDNPQSMKGALISGVIGDGDWVVLANYCAANKLLLNPDPTTYDADAVNVVPAPNDDFKEAAKDLIKSKLTGYTIPLKEVKNGKLTGKTLNKAIEGCVTWTPGDKMVFDKVTGVTDIVSTKDFVNQMATGLYVIKEYALAHEKEVISLLKQTYTANNQVKLYDEWAVKAADCVAKTYNFENGKYWYDMFKGQTGSKDGLDYHIGGTLVFNYADALQYYGITDGNNRYKVVYNQVSTYLTDLNPGGFNQACKSGIVPYEDAVNLYFLKSISDVDAGTAVKQDYSKTKTDVMANGHWNINFATGSTAIDGSEKDLTTIYNLLVEAEATKLQIVGHTDNVGGSDANITLSKGRANSVVQYLTSKGISSSRFQLVDGKGDTEPIADNTTAAGRAKNRRVDITLLK